MRSHHHCSGEHGSAFSSKWSCNSLLHVQLLSQTISTESSLAVPAFGQAEPVLPFRFVCRPKIGIDCDEGLLKLISTFMAKACWPARFCWFAQHQAWSMLERHKRSIGDTAPYTFAWTCVRCGVATAGAASIPATIEAAPSVRMPINFLFQYSSTPACRTRHTILDMFAPVCTSMEIIGRNCKHV